VAALTLELLYFAETARRTGRSREVLTLPENAKLQDLQEEILRRYPALRELQEQLLWSVDEEMVGPATELRHASRVGVMPPFSGG
jgi:molybdopterin converting factor small subunit